jgi:4-hydroxybenzoate polyprenyltransferase
VPLLLGHLFDAANLAASLLAFFAFSFAASSAYVLDDLLDLPTDRRHPNKRRRPFAAGLVRLDQALLLSAGLAFCALILALQVNPLFLQMLGVYYGLTLAYSLILKRKILVDVVILGGLYAMRVLAGGAAVNAPESKWFLLFCFFQFLGLAIAKRITELHGREHPHSAQNGRGYQPDDLRVLMPLGAGAAFGAPLVKGLCVSAGWRVRLPLQVSPARHWRRVARWWRVAWVARTETPACAPI